MILNDIDRPDGTADLWGTTVFANSAGSWKGTWSGIIGRNSGWQIVSSVLRGRGGYDGLMWALTGIGPAGGDIKLSGAISVTDVGGSPPPRSGPAVAVSGRLDCSQGASGTAQPTASAFVLLPVATALTCSLVTSDPRTTGQVEAHHYVNAGYNALERTGAVAVIEANGGTWQGGWTGWRNPAADGSILEADVLFRGTGDFEGLELLGRITGPGLSWSLTGTIAPWR